MAVKPENYVKDNVWFKPDSMELVNEDSGKRINLVIFKMKIYFENIEDVPNLGEAIDYYGYEPGETRLGILPLNDEESLSNKEK